MQRVRSGIRYAYIELLGDTGFWIIAVVYLASIALCAVACGLVLDQIYSKLGIDALSIAGSASEVMPDEVKNVFAVLLLPLLVCGMYSRKGYVGE